MKTRTVLCLLTLVAACAAVSGDAAPQAPTRQKPEAEPELKWAEGVVNEFFDALKSESPAVRGLLSPEFAAAWPLDGTYPPLGWYSFPPSSLSKTVAPNGGEIIYTGRVKGKEIASGNAIWLQQDADLLLRVARESGGRWSIRYLKLQERKATEANRVRETTK
jgi:hypothetical protein